MKGNVPLTDEECTVALSRARGLGPKLFRELLERFHSPKEIIAAGPRGWQQVPGIGPTVVEAIECASEGNGLRRFFDSLEEQAISVSVLQSSDYPQQLKNTLGSSAPLCLYHKGPLPTRAGVAVVGTRKPTAKGREQAAWFSGELAALGLPIISGLARGIDACGHRAALHRGGATVAVLGTPIDIVYPPEHRDLAAEICKNGSLVSEYPPGTATTKGCFPHRNRIIAGLATTVLIVESGLPSGALNTAWWGAQLGLDVWTIPGHIDVPQRWGNHQLLKEGAALALSPGDIAQALGIEHPQTVQGAAVSIKDLAAMGLTPSQIVDRTGLKPHVVLAELTKIQLQLEF